MRVREWYGWHFPEMSKVIADNIQYAKVVRKMGYRKDALKSDLSDIISEENENDVKEAAQTSMGTEISSEDLDNIKYLCEQVINISEYRTSLWEYLKNRMATIAPNLTTMVGELVGARLIAHAGSLMSLAKHPASTVQILGAEKALFRALKTKHDTPKYGLIYHASLVGQAAPKLKGKISRVLAAKTALAIRVDALGEASEPSIAIEARAKVEKRLEELEGGKSYSLSGKGKTTTTQQKPVTTKSGKEYNTAADSTMEKKEEKKTDKKKEKKVEEAAEEEAPKKEKKKDKKEKKSADAEEEEAPKKEKKDKKKKAAEEDGEEEAPKKEKKDKKKKAAEEEEAPKKEKKDKKRKAEEITADEEEAPKKEKKNKKQKTNDSD
jgi:nucleolar protein 58